MSDSPESSTVEPPPSAPARRRRSPGRHEGKPGATKPSCAVQGVLWHRDGRQPVLIPNGSFLPTPSSLSVPRELIQPWDLCDGLLVDGTVDPDHPSRLIAIDAVEGLDPEDYRRRARPFARLVSIDPEERFVLETPGTGVEARVAELIAPVGKGQRCLIVAPPRAGKTTLLQQIAHAIAVNHPDATMFVLLIDERPEEVTDWRRGIARGQVFASSSDHPAEHHVHAAELVLERARRLVELGEDVVVFLDSLTRLARAYNTTCHGSGRILSGGLDARTMERPRRFFGAARNVDGGGSLTVVATCLVDTGSRMDEVIFQEFQGTGNMELVLSRALFEKRIFPCVDIPRSGTRKEEKLYPRDEVEKLHLMRRALATLSPDSAMELLVRKVREFPTNRDFLRSLQLR